ncbi:hypothetical protein KA078_02305 [Candidatus Woesebacteria bacterium]|nr:hypothetical protein [Candidatus Woesebacteria bacterium]
MSAENTQKIIPFNERSVTVASEYVETAAKNKLIRNSKKPLNKIVRGVKRLFFSQKEASDSYLKAEIQHAAQKLIFGMHEYTAMALEVDEILQTPGHPREQVLGIEAKRHALHLQLVELATQLAMSQDELNTLIQLQLEDALSKKMSTELSLKMSQSIGITVTVQDDDLLYIKTTAENHKNDAIRLATHDEKPGTYSLILRIIFRPRDAHCTPFKSSVISGEPALTIDLVTQMNDFFSQLSQNHPELQAQFRQFSSHYCHDYEYYPGDDFMALQLLTTKLTFSKRRIPEIEKVLKESSPFISRK